MDIIPSIINTILLLLLFWYQKGKNKILEDRLTEQKQNMTELKDIVSHQATAITSQGAIVKSAMEYSQIFDANKIRDIVKKEVEIEKTKEIQNLNAEYQKKLSAIAKMKDKKFEIVYDAIKKISEYSVEYIRKEINPKLIEAVTTAVIALTRLPNTQREEILESINNDDLKRIISEAVHERLEQMT